MKITTDILKSTIIKKNYKWFDNLNIIGIRSTIDIPNVFNDFMVVVWENNIMAWTITTDPGTYWLNNPISKLGTAVLKPNQYLGCYSLGFHQGKSEHPALVQSGKVTVYRDNNRDSKIDKSTKEETGLFGINIHRSNSNGRTMTIGKWSAGCQVFQYKPDHDKFLSICNLYKKELNNKFTYTLLDERDFY